MITLLEKHWPLTSILLVGLLIGTLLFFPMGANGLAMVVTVLCIAMAAAFAARPRLAAYRQDQISRGELVRLLALDLTGITLSMAAAVLVGRLAGKPAASAAAGWLESAWPGHGERIGMLAGILAALLAGIGTGVLVHRAWGKLTTDRSRDADKRTEADLHAT